MRMHSRSPQSQLQRRRSRSCEDIKGIITHKSKHTAYKRNDPQKVACHRPASFSLSSLSLLDYTLYSLNAIHIPKHTHTHSGNAPACLCVRACAWSKYKDSKRVEGRERESAPERAYTRT